MTTVAFRQKKSAMSVLQSLRTPDSPVSAIIHVADRCNEVCVHCYQVQGQKGELDTSDWKKILDELAQMGVLFLTVSGGEATLRKDFLELVRYARKLKFAVKLFTNGLTMNDALAATLAELAVQEVQISLYSTKAEVHDWVTGVKGSWERTVAGVRALVAVGVPTVIKTPLFSFNVEERSAYVQFAAELGVDFSVDANLDPREDGDRTPETLAVTPAQRLEMMRDPRFSRAAQPPVAPALTDGVCGACSGGVNVEANGEVRPCSLLAVPLGDARAGVRAAWGSETAQQIRSLRWMDLHGCRACDLRAYCRRCFSNAKADTGDALAPYAVACGKAKTLYEQRHGAPPTIDANGLDPSIGPYRATGDGTFECFSAPLEERDEALARARPWLRGPRAAPRGSSVVPGELVQIRRPGAKTPRAEVVAGAKHDVSSG